jgi:hypothetical protein
LRCHGPRGNRSASEEVRDGPHGGNRGGGNRGGVARTAAFLRAQAGLGYPSGRPGPWHTVRKITHLRYMFRLLRYYNLVNRQAGRPSSPLRGTAARLFCCPRPGPVSPHLLCTNFQTVVSDAHKKPTMPSRAQTPRRRSCHHRTGPQRTITASWASPLRWSRRIKHDNNYVRERDSAAVLDHRRPEVVRSLDLHGPIPRHSLPHDM